MYASTSIIDWFGEGFSFCITAHCFITCDCIHRYKVRSYARSINRQMWNYGSAGNIELLLSVLHVFVSIIYGHWRCMSLDLYASVSHFKTILKAVIRSLSNYRFRSTLQGKTSHKFVDPNENPIMRLYYQKDILTFMCCGNELFYSALYLLYFTNGPTGKCCLDFQ